MVHMLYSSTSGTSGTDRSADSRIGDSVPCSYPKQGRVDSGSCYFVNRANCKKSGSNCLLGVVRYPGGSKRERQTRRMLGDSPAESTSPAGIEAKEQSYLP